MGHLCSLNQIALSFGDKKLFGNLSFHVNEGERIGIIGANGVGKSTLLKLLLGLETPDSGTSSSKKDLRIGVVKQSPKFDPQKTVEQVLLDSMQNNQQNTAIDMQENEVDQMVKASIIIEKLGFPDSQQKTGEMSGGWIKRVALAVALVDDPDLLLMDEPTNHLDINGTIWLESWLSNSRLAAIIISHDRAFLEATATRIVEISKTYPDDLLSFEGGYSNFLEMRADFLQAQNSQLNSLASKVRREIEWLKRGPKARSTKNKFRVEKAHEMKDELSRLRGLQRKTLAEIDFSASGRRTKRLLVARSLKISRGQKLLFENLDILLKPGLRIGLVGKNGSGKSTLLKIMMSQLDPDSGELELADNLKIVYFDQQREALDPDQSLKQALCKDGDSVLFKDRLIHVASWARRFGFDTKQLDTKVGRLSGGEQSKVQIAKLMLEEADVLLLDEPTNDLDLPTLEILEQNLKEFSGAIVLVTHDRYMLDQLANVVLGLDSEGGHIIVADYAQWLEHLSSLKKKDTPKKENKKPKAKPANKAKKLGYLEQREYDTLEDKIMQADKHLESLNKKLEEPEIASNHLLAEETYKEIETANKEVSLLYQRWEELEAKLG